MKHLLTLTLLFISSLAIAGSGIEISGAMVKKPMPGRKMSAAFMDLKNTTDKDIKLVSASATWAGKIELHTHIHDKKTGTMKMREVESILIPAGKTTQLKSGGLHLMLFRLNLPLPKNPKIKLCYEKSGCETITTVLKGLDK